MRLLILVFAFVSATYAQASVQTDDLPSSIISDLARNTPEAIKGLNDSVEKKRTLISHLWPYAAQGSPVDNRAYIFALLIDLYNSIPPDATIDIQPLEPGEDVYEPNLLPIKEQIYQSSMAQIDGKTREPREAVVSRTGWQSLREDVLRRYEEGSSEADQHLKGMLETIYFIGYIEDQVRAGNIVLDDPRSSADWNSAEVDLSKPTYYPMLADYRDRVNPLITNLVDPWQAEGFWAEEGSGKAVETEPQTKSLPGRLDGSQPSSSNVSEKDLPSVIEDEDWIFPLIGFLTVIVFSALFVFRKR